MAQFSLPQNSKIEVGIYYKDKTNVRYITDKTYVCISNIDMICIYINFTYIMHDIS